MADPESDRRRAYWKRTRVLALTLVGVWFVAAFVVHLAAPVFNQVRLLGFPLGFYIAAQGSLMVFVLLLAVFVVCQDRIDRDFDMDET
ncbi:DUF4212 domain-containing protein [Vineibacter terrae]|uniref:DUF4212 domain-containing protein n=1 Tax=Vineibacter terrae TaxID=2586908 RepID=UPI002E2FAA35|nr:DUF4212 domain-containing protein [Vineibacter terrae]HEX2891685.1 DUF4212 domain-containing protein [Vineibacter terrae]